MFIVFADYQAYIQSQLTLTFLFCKNFTIIHLNAVVLTFELSVKQRIIYKSPFYAIPPFLGIHWL